MRLFRRLQVTLGLLWMLDGLLQLQPANLGASFPQAIVGNAMGEPSWMQCLVIWTASIFGEHPVVADLGLAVAQIGLGVAIVCPRTRRVGLLASVPWAIGVWVLGEALGSIPTGFAMLPSGAPGAALLYAVAAIVLLPKHVPARSAARSAAGHGAIGDRATAIIWAVLWAGAALLQSIPVGTLGFKLSAGSQMASLGEPGALVTVDHAVGGFAASHGPEVTAVLVGLELAIGTAALVGDVWRRRLLTTAFVVCPVIWFVGENLGGLATGAATDPGAMPLYVLLALTLLPLSSARARPDVRPWSSGGCDVFVCPVELGMRR